MQATSAKVVAAIESVHGTKFEYGSISRIIYQSSGSSVDYMYGVHGLVQSYGPELRDTGQYGFLLPEEQIVPSGEEIFAAVLVMADELANQEQEQVQLPHDVV
jgi:hypothetical protein